MVEDLGDIEARREESPTAAASRRIFAFGGAYYGEHADTYADQKPEGDYWPVDTERVDELIVAACGRDEPRVTVITTASEDGRGKARLVAEANERRWAMHGGRARALMLVEEQPGRDEIEAAVLDADIVFVTGGNSVQMIETWQRLGIDRLLREAYDAGTVMAGTSAGAICWFRYGNSDSFYTGKPFCVPALGWIDAWVCPHYDTEAFRQRPFQDMIRSTPELVGIALDEFAALEIADGSFFRVHALRPGATAHKCHWDAAAYHVEDVEVGEWSDLETLLAVPAASR